MCQEHPFHSLYQVYCISDHTSLNATTRRQSMSNASQATQTDRGTAATSIMDRLRSDPTRDNKRVRDLERLCDASLQWAKFPIKGQNSYKNRSGPFPIPSALKILSIENLRIPVTTARTPVDPTMKYDNCVWIQRYDPSFNTAGGVNMPKITVCYSTDGTKFKQLVLWFACVCCI